MFIGMALSLSWDCAQSTFMGIIKMLGYPLILQLQKEVKTFSCLFFGLSLKNKKMRGKLFYIIIKKAKVILSFKNKMILGYLRSLFITVIAFTAGDLKEWQSFSLCNYC